MLITWFAAKIGYQGGHEYLSKLQGGDLMEKLMYVCGIVGLMSVGGMIATLIGATTPLQFAEGTVVIQDILDGIMPGMLGMIAFWLYYWLLSKKINPMVGAAGISAFPMSGRIVHKMGLAEDPQNFLLMHSIGVNVSGQIASVIAGGLILKFFGA